MKKLQSFSILSVLFLFILHLNPVTAQNNLGTEMSYKVDFGPVYPIEGKSIQLKGELGLNDTTGTVEKLNFEVSLTSFQGTNAGYLGWVANSWNNPDMSFKSNSIKKKGDHWVAKGLLEFRRRNNPVEIEFYHKTVGREIALEGHFQLRPRDYFITTPSLELVPTTIPVKFTMLFDQPSELNVGEEAMISDSQKGE